MSECKSCFHCAELAALRSLAPTSTERVSVPREPVGYVMQAEIDGSYGAELAVVAWSTFEKQMEKLRENPWVKAGRAKIVPLYAAASGQSQDVTTAKSAESMLAAAQDGTTGERE